MTVEQNERFDKLESMLAALNQSMDPSATTATLGKDIYLRQVQTDEHTVSLTACAAAIFSSAATVAGRSTSGATTLMKNAPAFEFIGETANGAPARMHGESTTGSEYGEPLNPQKRTQMQDWLRNIADPEAIPDTPSAIDSSMSHRSTAVSPILSNPSPTSDGAPARQMGAIALEMFYESSEDDDDLDLEVARNIFRKAESSLAARDHHGAKALFQEGLVIADNLSAKRRSLLKLGQIRMRYADHCCLFTNDLTSAENVYQKVMKEQPVDTATQERILTAGHNLSFVKLRQHDTWAAEKYCRQTLNGRRKAQSVGKDHPDYRLTLRLLTIILWAKGAHVQARHYVELLPVKNRPNLEQELAMLTSPSATSKQWLYTTYLNVEASVKDAHAECPKGEIYVQGSIDQVHSSKTPSLSYAVETKEPKDGESPDLDRSSLFGSVGSRTLNQRPCLVQKNSKNPLSEKKDEQSRIGEQDQQQTIPHHLQQTSQQNLTDVTEPDSSQDTSPKCSHTATDTFMAAGPWLHAIEFVHNYIDPRVRFQSILKVLVNGNDTILVNQGPDYTDMSKNDDPTTPVVNFGSDSAQCRFIYFSQDKGNTEARHGWFFSQELPHHSYRNGIWERENTMRKICTDEEFQLGPVYMRPDRRLFRIRLLMCRKSNGGFERREMIEDEDTKNDESNISIKDPKS